MKKRIGPRLYDTDTSEMVADVGVGIMYRKKTRDREWFLLAGEHILPMTESEARAALGESSYIEKSPEPTMYHIRVDRETHERITSAARKEGISMAEVVRKMAENML